MAKKEKAEKAEKKEKKVKNKKESYVELVGITGEGIDYAVYHMNLNERVTGGAVGFALGFVMAHIFFANVIVSTILGCILAYLAQGMYRDMLLSKRKDRVRLQFRDFLESLSASYSAGQTAIRGFSDAKDDLTASYGDDAELVKELKIILRGLESNYQLDKLLNDFGKRAHMDNISNFVDTYVVCYTRGGNVRKVVNETKQIINDQMEIEQDIQTKITENKSSVNIIAIMPFIIVMVLRMSGNDTIAENTFTNCIIKIIALGIFVGSYMMARKIMNIKF